VVSWSIFHEALYLPLPDSLSVRQSNVMAEEGSINSLVLIRWLYKVFQTVNSFIWRKPYKTSPMPWRKFVWISPITFYLCCLVKRTVRVVTTRSIELVGYVVRTGKTNQYEQNSTACLSFRTGTKQCIIQLGNEEVPVGYSLSIVRMLCFRSHVSRSVAAELIT
jgi:hypothetical protein